MRCLPQDDGGSVSSGSGVGPGPELERQSYPRTPGLYVEQQLRLNCPLLQRQFSQQSSCHRPSRVYDAVYPPIGVGEQTDVLG